MKVKKKSFEFKNIFFGLWIAFALFGIICFVSFAIQSTEKTDKNNKLTDKQKAILAAEYGLTDITDRIVCAEIIEDSLRIEVEKYESFEKLLDSFDFKSKDLYNMTLKKRERFNNSYTKISGDIVSSIIIDSVSELNSDIAYTVYIYECDNGYGFATEKTYISNSKVFDIF